MKELFVSVLKDIALYNNDSFMISLFIFSLCLLWFLERDKGIRNVLVYLSTALICIFLCPIMIAVANKFDAEIYYRVWWSIPMGMTVCYLCVKVMLLYKELWKKCIAILIAVAIIVLNGKCIYTNAYRFKVENNYHLPQMVVDVADYVTQEYDTPVTIMALELMIYVRQYNSDIQVPFSRYYFGDTLLENQELYDALNASEYDTKLIADYAKAYKALYVVLNGSIPQIGSMEEQGFTYLDWIDGYYIYRYEQLYKDYIEYGAIKKNNG